MEVYHGIENVRLAASTESTVAIGVFDGVHLGHQTVLAGAAAVAARTGLKPIALTFDINPAVLLAPAKAPPSICTLKQRMDLIGRFGGGIDSVVVIPFTREFAALSPEEFVRTVLGDCLRARHVFVGSDFRYGHERIGDGRSLVEDGKRNGFNVDIVEPVVLDGERISSTRIRALVRDGDVGAAERLLGHEFQVVGTVAHGKKLGRQIGFPTANLQPDESQQLLPADGVYAGYTELPDGRRIRSAVSVGTNPTTDSDGLRKVEAYLLDGFDEDIYDTRIGVSFRNSIRGQVEFGSLDALIETIRDDVARIDRLLTP